MPSTATGGGRRSSRLLRRRGTAVPARSKHRRTTPPPSELRPSELRPSDPTAERARLLGGVLHQGEYRLGVGVLDGVCDEGFLAAVCPLGAHPEHVVLTLHAAERAAEEFAQLVLPRQPEGVFLGEAIQRTLGGAVEVQHCDSGIVTRLDTYMGNVEYIVLED